MKKNDNNLPAKKSNKLKRAFLIFLAAIGVSTSTPVSTLAAESQTNKQIEDTSNEKVPEETNAFLEGLKVEIPAKVDYKQKAIDIVKEKNFGAAVSGNEIAQEKIAEMFDKIDENAPRYASLHGITDTGKYVDNMKQLMYTQINEWLNDLIIVDKRTDETKKYYKTLGIARGITLYGTHEIYLRNGKDISDESYMTLTHELAHTAQSSSKDSKVLPNYKKVYKRLKEGMAVDYKKRVADIDNPNTEYAKDYILYSVINNFSDGQVEQWMKGEISTGLYSILCNNLDEKYGENTGEKLYTMIAGLSRIGSQYGLAETLEENLEKQAYIKGRISEIENDSELSAEEKESQIKEYKAYLQCNKNYYSIIEEKGTTPSIDGKSVVAQEMKEFQKFVLGLYQKDFEQITSKEDAKQALVKWNEYKATCMVRKNGHREENDPEIAIENSMQKAQTVQQTLFEKCQEFGILDNSINEVIFNAVLDSNINDILNVTVVSNGNKLTVMDKYGINYLTKGKDNNYDVESVKKYSKKIAKLIEGKKTTFIENDKELSK